MATAKVSEDVKIIVLHLLEMNREDEQSKWDAMSSQDKAGLIAKYGRDRLPFRAMFVSKLETQYRQLQQDGLLPSNVTAEQAVNLLVTETKVFLPNGYGPRRVILLDRDRSRQSGGTKKVADGP